MFSPKFCEKLREVFDSDKPLLATIKKIDCELTKELKAREDVQIFEVTPQNRNEISNKILCEVVTLL